MRKDCIEAIEKEKIITIIRGVYGENLMNLLDAVYRGGIRLAEITFDSAGKVGDGEIAENIAEANKKFRGKLIIGAGTVTKKSQISLAKSAGAEYIISPDTNCDIISFTRENDLVSVPGAMTPTEAMTAHRAGADFVKLFPAGCFGATYLKTVALPLSNIKFLAVGGINAEDVKDYLNAGAVGFGISSGIADKNLVLKGDFEEIYRRAREYVRLVKN